MRIPPARQMKLDRRGIQVRKDADQVAIALVAFDEHIRQHRDAGAGGDGVERALDSQAACAEVLRQIASIRGAVMD